jgi:hypothetical protein
MYTRARVQRTHLHRLVAVGSEVLGLQADGEAAPQAGRHAHKQVPILDDLEGDEQIG